MIEPITRYEDVALFELCESLKLPPQRLDRLNARRTAARHGAPEESNGGLDAFASDADRLARFAREAQTLAL